MQRVGARRRVLALGVDVRSPGIRSHRAARGRGLRHRPAPPAARPAGWRRVATPTWWPRRASSTLRSSTIRSSPPTTGAKDWASIRSASVIDALHRSVAPGACRNRRLRGRIARARPPAARDSTLPPISVVICAYTLERLELLAAAIDSLAGTDRPAARDRPGRSTTRRTAGGGLRGAGPACGSSPTSEQQGLSGARNTGLAESRRRGRRLPRRRRRGGARLARAPRRGLRRPRGARRRRHGAAELGRGPAGLVPAGVRLGRRLHPLGHAAPSGSRCATWSAPTCPSAATRWSRSAASATSWAGSGRSRPAARRPTSASASASASPRARSSTTPRPRSTTSCRRPAAELALLHLALPRRGALEGGPRRPGRQRRRALRTSAPTFAAPCRSASCAGSATPSAATSAASAGRRRSSLGLLATTAGYLGAPRGGARARPPPRAGRRTATWSAPRVLMVTPRSPLAQGGVERHVMEVSRRIAAAGAEVEVLCTEPGRPAACSEEVRDGVDDPHRARLAGRTATGASRRGSGARWRASPGTWSTSSPTTRWSRRWRCCGR